MVVLHHSIITTFAPSLHHLTAGLLPAHWWVAFNTYLSPLRMPAFFFVSGLLAASSITKKSWKEVHQEVPQTEAGIDSVGDCRYLRGAVQPDSRMGARQRGAELSLLPARRVLQPGIN